MRLKKDSRQYKKIVEETETYANYIVRNNATIRSTADFFNVVLCHKICKSAIHYRIENILSKENPKLYEKVRMVIDKNSTERSKRAGIATKIKYGKEV